MIDNYTASGAWRNESIADIAARLVIEKPDMLAFIEGDRSLYLGNLVTKARKIAAVLATRGLVPGDVVSFQLPNWLETAVINLACCIGGFVCNPIIPIYREAEVGYILRDGRAKILFVPTSRSEEHTSELQSLMRISYAVFCLKKKHKQHSHMKQ